MNRWKLFGLRLYNGILLQYSTAEIFRLIIFKRLISSLNARKRMLVPLMKIDMAAIKTIVISLPYRTDRRDVLSNNLNSNGVPFSFVDGINIDATTALKNSLDKISPQSLKYLSKGTIGCILAHERAIKYFLTSSYQFCVVFEDDVIVSNSYITKLGDIIVEIPENFDIVYLGSGNKIASNMLGWVTRCIYVPLFPRRGQYSYLLSRNGAQKILSHLFPVKIVLGGIDTLIGRLVTQNVLTAYHLFPSICSVDLQIDSDIKNPSKPTKSIYHHF